MQPEAVAANNKYDILSKHTVHLGQVSIFEIEELNELAEKYNKTVGQIILRWSLQHGFLPLPKTATLSRAAENADIFDFELEAEDLKVIDSFEGRAGKMSSPDEKPY